MERRCLNVLISKTISCSFRCSTNQMFQTHAYIIRIYLCYTRSYQNISIAAFGTVILWHHVVLAPTRSHGLTTHKTTVDIIKTMRISNWSLFQTDISWSLLQLMPIPQSCKQPQPDTVNPSSPVVWTMSVCDFSSVMLPSNLSPWPLNFTLEKGHTRLYQRSMGLSLQSEQGHCQVENWCPVCHFLGGFYHHPIEATEHMCRNADSVCPCVTNFWCIILSTQNNMPSIADDVPSISELLKPFDCVFCPLSP
jgi:hypothetical protein